MPDDDESLVAATLATAAFDWWAGSPSPWRAVEVANKGAVHPFNMHDRR